MQIRYSNEPAFEGGLSIFLAGPTPRAKEVPSWRPQAIEILRNLGFQGTVLIPERQDWTVKFEYTDQVDWEYAGLTNASVILFWVPRDMQTMPALTTNVEFGYWIAEAPERVVYGRPDTAANVRYLDWMFRKHNGGTPHNRLEDTLRAAVELANTKSTSQK